MSHLTNVMKSVQMLNALRISDISSDSVSSKKNKISCCTTIVEEVRLPTVKQNRNFPHILTIAIENLLALCDDEDSDVRMIADESLNKIIRIMLDSHIVKVQIEFYNEIKRNGPARVLRAALWRFGLLSHMIHPTKGKAYVSNLIPCITIIARRSEDIVIETLSLSLPLILKVLGPFMTDSNVKTLLQTFFKNISSTQAVFRRAAANMILTTCINCRKPQFFLNYVLNHLLGLIMPVRDAEDRIVDHSSTIIGVFGCLRITLPYVCKFSESEEGDVETQQIDSLLHIYELCLHYTRCHSDHNIINAALETLVQLLKKPPKSLISVLLSSKGITQSKIILNQNVSALSMGQMSISSANTAYGDNSESSWNLDDTSEITTSIDKQMVDADTIPPITRNSQIQEEYSNDVIEMKEKILDTDCPQKVRDIHNEVIEENNDVGSEIEKSGKAQHSKVQSEQFKEEECSQTTTSSPKKSSLEFMLYETDVGTFTDSDLPVKFCCRYLVSSFLLAGKPGDLVSDKLCRVSVKSLALTCVAYILKLYPHLFTMTVAKEPICDENDQLIADILLFADHSDPQIRGNVAIVIGNFLKSVFIQYGGVFQNFETESISQKGHKIILLKDLIKLLLKGLNDDSATTCRQTLDALNLCLPELLDSSNNEHGLAILTALPKLMKNPYFLVKVKLVDLLSKLSYITIEHITGQSLFQEHFINAIIVLLGDQDQRVRHAAAEAIVKSIPCLYFRHPQEDTVTRKATYYTQQFLSAVTSSIIELSSCQNRHKLFVNTSIKPLVFLNNYNRVKSDFSVEYSLSRIVNILTEILTVHSSKYLIYGCCETLFCLSETYPTTTYVRGWNCILPKTLFKKSKKSSDRLDISDNSFMNEMILSPVGSGLLSMTLPLLMSSTISLDLSTHRHLILLAGNLASGLAMCNFNSCDSTKLWDMCKNKHMELLLTHIMRVLNIFVHVIDEVQVTQAIKPVLLSLSSAQTLSPKKRIILEQKSKEKGEGIGSFQSEEEKIGTFIGISHYMKIYDILKAAHSNYLVTLEYEASEMYLSLLNAMLDVLSQLLEIASINEAGRIAEELLCYLKTTVILSPTATVQCVQQLLKCLFGTNVCAQWTEMDIQKNMDRYGTFQDDRGFYNQCFQYPARQMANTIKFIGNNCRGENEPDTGWTGLLRRKGDRKFSSVLKTLTRFSDQKTSVASFIRLFEPMVIKSLKQYTVTNNILLQCQVLNLLSQLVQLKVNYCLLDSDKIFIGFVIKQFEFIEEGHIQQTEDLLPKIFNFLVHLSYEKYHSQPIIGIPKIIHLCDGLMASGQPAISHCIPALAPVIEDIFLFRNGSSNVIEQRELETTREVLISVLLRLVEYHQVIELLALCLAESRYSGDGNGEEKWRRWSRLTIDNVLPILETGKLRIESEKAHIALVKLFAAISPTVFRPVDPLLKILFTTSISIENSTLKLKRWLGMINILLLSLISCAKEEAMLARLSVLNIDVTDLSHLSTQESYSHTDPLNALGTQSCKIPPEQILARFIFKVINLVSSKVFDLLGLINHKSANPFVGFSDYTADDNYLVHQFTFFLQLCIHMFESGSHCKVANAAMQMIQGRNIPTKEQLAINELNYLMLSIGNVCPPVTCQWAYLMILLGYNEMSFWSKVLDNNKSDYAVHTRANEKRICSYANRSINIEIIRKGGIILFCDYICENLNDVEPLTWLLVNHIEEAINIATESPVRDLLMTAIHRNSAASGLLVQAIATKCTDLSQPSFIKRLLQCIEGAHHSQSGAVIMTLIPRLLSTKYLALSRMAAKIASRRVEILLTTSADDVINQLSKDDVIKIMDTLQTTKLARKHGGLISLLNKLAVQYYDLSPLELDQCRPFNPSTIKSIQLDRNWFLSQVKLRCCNTYASNNPMELAQLLKDVDFDDCLSILSCKEFNLRILKHCIILGARLSVERCQKLEFGKAQNEKDFNFDASPLYVAARQSLLEHIHYICELIPKPHQIYNPEADDSSGKELKYAAKFSDLLSDSLYWEILFTIIPTVKVYMKSLPKLAKYNVAKIDIKFEEDIAKFSILCFELAHWMIYSDKLNVKKLRTYDMDLALSCAAEILKHGASNKIFGDSTRYTWVCSAVISLTKVVESILTMMDPLPIMDSEALKPALQDEDTKDYARACIQIASIVAWLEKCQVDGMKNIPPYLFSIIKSLVVSISRQPLVNSYVLTPPLVWKRGWNIVGSGPTKCYFPLLSSESNLLQEVDILEQFIYRVNLLGWTSRSQFEEIWMAFLSVLNYLQNENMSSEEVASLIQASSLAVQAITKLLLQTLLLPCPGNPEASTLIHHPRDPQLSVHKISSQKLYGIQELLLWKYEYVNDVENKNGLKLDHIFCRGNLERIATVDKVMYSQLSVSYLWSLCNLYEDKLNVSVLDLKNRRNDALMSASLDLDSCLRFLIEHYTIWLSPQTTTPIQLLTEIIKSVLAISELFLERSQYQWMLDVCLEISKIHPIENAILHQYLVVSICKAAAVLTPLDFDTLDKVKRIVDVNLKSTFLAARISALHGILYLLQSAVLAKCEETMNIIHPLAIEYIQKHIDSQDSNGVISQSEEHQGIMWALVFFLLEHAEDSPPDTEAPAVLELVLSLVTSQNISYGLHQTLLQGLERLVATKSIIGKVAEQIVKVAIDRLKQPNPLLALPALQLLITCMYTEAADRLNQPGVEKPLPDVEPETLVRSIERISAIFDKIKKGHSMEVEILCTILSGILGDFFPPSEILTKVIGEFLSPQQPHARLLSAVVFKVCEKACTCTELELLQDWMVFSLPNFIQSLPMTMSTWCLSCFFISASTNHWLRALFPYVQSRIGKYEYEDKKILCIAASDFYHKLSKVSQKKAFVETFEMAAKEPGTPFSDILASF